MSRRKRLGIAAVRLRPIAGLGACVCFCLFVDVCGCDDGAKSAVSKPAERPFQGVVVNLVGERAILDAVELERGEWERSRGGRIEFQSGGNPPTGAATPDVIFFRGDRFGDLIDKNELAVLPETFADPPVSVSTSASSDGEVDPGTPSRRVDFEGIAPAFRDQGSHYGKFRQALPIGGSALVLVYRKDAFRREENVRAAKEAGLALEPPETWEALDELAGFFQGRDWDGDGSKNAGIALAMGPDLEEGVADAIALSRAASLGMHPDDYSFLFDGDTLAPRVASPPFVETFQALKRLSALGPLGMSAFGAESARASFRRGETALLIDRAERRRGWVDPKTARGRNMSIGVAALPGSKRVYDRDRSRWDDSRGLNRPTWLLQGGGMLVGVSSRSPEAKRAAVLDFLSWLIAPETASRMRADARFDWIPVRDALIGQDITDARRAPGLDGRLWSAAVGQTIHAPRVSPGLRIPDTRGYLVDFGRARAKVLDGREPAEALQDLSRAWSGRSEALGLRRQIWHYRRSLIELPADDSPPPRATK